MSSQPESERAIQLREEFLEGVAVRLRREMSAFELHDTLDELKAHLDASTAAFEELGLGPEEAARAAIGRLGEPKRIGNGILKENRSLSTRDKGVVMVLGALTGALWVPFGWALLIIWASAYTFEGVDLASYSIGAGLIGAVYGSITALCVAYRRRSLWSATWRGAIVLPIFMMVLTGVLLYRDPQSVLSQPAFTILGAVRFALLGAGMGWWTALFGNAASAAARTASRKRS